MARKLASVISYVLHPLLMPVYLFGMLLLLYPGIYSPLTEHQVSLLIMLIAMTTFAFPVMSVVVMKFSGLVTSYKLSERRERPLPFLFTTLFYGVTAVMFYHKFAHNNVFAIIMLIVTVLLMVMGLITMLFKISIHSAAISGALGILWAIKLLYPDAMLLLPIIGFIIILGAVMSSRMQLYAHTPLEVYSGAIIGFGICFFGGYTFL